MKHSKRIVRVVSLAVTAALCTGLFTFLAGCNNGKKDVLTIMTQDLNGLYNPFFSTAGTDMDVVGQTQISMFSTDENGNISYGDNEAVVVKDYMKRAAGAETEYYFVLKNGIKFSDGEPLTMNDVLFNMYVYLDPAYTGSTTMYSTDIVGLQRYRQQKNVSGEGSQQDDQLTAMANNRAFVRRQELINAYTAADLALKGGVSDPSSTSKDVPENEMREFLKTYNPSQGYKNAVAVNGNITNEEAREQLTEDYEETLRLFKEELERDFASAQDAYQSAPYSNVDSDGDGKVEKTNESDIDFSNPVVAFMYMEGYIKLAYYRDSKTNEEDYNHIVSENSQGEKSEKGYDPAQLELKNKDRAREAAIKYVYDSKVASELHLILQLWATGGTLLTNYVGRAKDIFLHEQAGSDRPYPNIEGIVSLGHSSEQETITITHEDGTTVDYKIAHNHNDDGTPVDPDNEYDVLKIRINGTDPKAIWNFGFTVAPHHYYSDPDKYPVNIEKNQFGVEWGSFDFMQDVIQGTSAAKFGSVSKNMIPLGAGPYVATNRQNRDYPSGSEFYSDGIVYYKANPNFIFGEPKTKKMRYVVVSSSNAIDRLKANDVDFVEPQYTISNYKTLQGLEKKGYKYVSSWQLGYGYIGVNAGKVENINLRKAIMSAMNTRLALQYYVTGTAANICYPMSLVSWAYPREGGTFNGNDPLAYRVTNNGKDYMTFPYYGDSEDKVKKADDEAKAKINRYTRAAGVSKGSSALTMKFTIAGANTDHPCYAVFFHAAELLNACGWKVSVEPDLNALTKLATGSLTVWAAAWGSTIDPDMYQVYHKNSTATSVYAWGYREILANPSKYSAEMAILNPLSNLIDDARETDVQTERAKLYKQAMDLVLDLAVEMPVYQRKTLYAFNSKTIDLNSLTLETSADGQLLGNSYQSPLSRIWEVELL